METVKEKINNFFEKFKDVFNYKNRMQSPKIKKVVISVGTGSITDKEKLELIPDRLAKITGQAPAYTTAKKSIAGFKVRQGQTVGYKVTLRGERMYNFLDKLIHIALPRTRDFRGLSLDAIDEMNNYTIGIPEHTIFPETSDEELKNVFGMAVTLVTTANSKEETEKLLREIGLPFKEKSTAQ